jgi:hypothetical protein
VSHFVTIVLVDEDNIKKHEKPVGAIGDLLIKPARSVTVEAVIDDLLAPFDENTEVEPYQKECWCVGRAAGVEVREQIERAFGPWEATRVSFLPIREKINVEHGLPPGAEPQWTQPKDDEERQNLKAARRAMDLAWDEHVHDRRVREEGLMAAHPNRKSPDPDCQECGGTGVETSTYNPNSKWDWWVIGGRWDGWIIREPEEEADKRRGEYGFPGERSCNLDNNSIRFGDIAFDDEMVPFAVVEPDGTWHEKARMGWWAMTADDKPHDQWIEICKTLQARHPDALAVACDLHI